jgi:hypothetical protein
MANLQLEVTLLQADEAGVLEADRVHRQLVTKQRRVLEGAQALLGDHLVVLVHVAEGREEDDLGLEPRPQLHELLEDLLPPRREVPDPVVAQVEAVG